MVTWPQVSVDTTKGYSNCFGCGQDNPIGLKLDFKWDGKTAQAEFTPSRLHQGWTGIVHGGIITCVLDEAMSYAALFGGAHCITAKMEIRMRRTVSINECLIITSSITKKTRRLAEAKANVSSMNGIPVAEGKATMFILNPTPRNTDNKKVESRGK